MCVERAEKSNGQTNGKECVCRRNKCTIPCVKGCTRMAVYMRTHTADRHIQKVSWQLNPKMISTHSGQRSRVWR